MHALLAWETNAGLVLVGVVDTCVYEVNNKTFGMPVPQTHTGAAAVAATVRPRTVLPDITRPDGGPAAFGGGAGLRPLCAGEPDRFGGGRGIMLPSMATAFAAVDAPAAAVTAAVEWNPRLVGRPPLGLEGADTGMRPDRTNCSICRARISSTKSISVSSSQAFSAQSAPVATA